MGLLGKICIYVYIYVYWYCAHWYKSLYIYICIINELVNQKENAELWTDGKSEMITEMLM